ncbi:HEAT repeat protein [Tahibacter aquaticus]|uniref:HEAT repeat protein n=1 Tax=Tahibacter aquaticus TaxID=520092 RepID=A0A4R6Z4E6_9GAMM|nr:HEAT repeat protein [Tahibacter aquaticus]
MRLSTHASDTVRWGVAFTLAGYAQPAAISTVLRLMADQDDDVRDYATWALGEMHEADTPEVRAALWRNIDDRNEHVCGEALKGLAARGDEDVIPHLISRLKPDCRVFELHAAESLAAPALLPALLALDAQCGEPARGESHYWRNRLGDAIAACQPKHA